MTVEHLSLPLLKDTLLSMHMFKPSLTQPPKMVSSPQPIPATTDEDSRISFSGEFPEDEEDFISIVPNSPTPKKDSEFEFLSTLNVNTTQPPMVTADELFFEGKLLPFQQISLNCKSGEREAAGMMTMMMKEKEGSKEERRVNWFVDDDPSPRPPSCTVLWKELLRLKKQRKPTLSPSSSSSSSSSSRSFGDLATIDEEKDGSEKGSGDGHVKRIKKGLERTRSATLRIRPMVNVPICTTQGKNNALPPLFSSIKKERLERLRR